MSALKKSSKISPESVPTPIKDNYLQKDPDIIRRLRILTFLDIFIGINRIYLYRDRKVMQWFGYFSSSVLVTITLYFFITNNLEGATLVYKDAACTEYLLLVLNTTFLQRRSLENIFRNFTKFDDMLNIKKDLNVATPITRVVIWMLTSVIYVSVEYSLLVEHVYGTFDYAELIPYLALVAHDWELLFICTMLRSILRRVRILKAHVAKEFYVAEEDTDKEELDEVESLSKNAKLDTTAMHRAYETLHNCAEDLNSLMSFPMIVMLFSSGLTTTMLMKIIFRLVQTTDGDTSIIKAMIVYASTRCIRYTFLMVIPCLFSSVTSKQVSIIRTMLHDAVNTLQLDKIERRKVKAFFQLTEDNKFDYALWGVIRLNMSLPLSYTSLCTTYLVIIIQFSKFID